jgi:putative Holliday junction resolvase
MTGRADSADSPSGCILAFDFGTRHIGVAVGQTVTTTATPLTTLSARDGQPDWPVVEALVSEWRPFQLVVGLPLNMDDTESEMCVAARRFGSRLAERTGVAVAMVDERLTTFEASDNSHAGAAALIAETWLKESQRR